MRYLDTKMFEREIERSYEDGKLSRNVKDFYFRILIDNIGFEFEPLKNREATKEIKDACMTKLKEDWKDYYYAKKSIIAYFTDLCRTVYRSRYLKWRKELAKV